MTTSKEWRIWDRHAEWWQREFTHGADPEYEEQLLPLCAEHLAGAERVVDIGCGEGQVSRLALAGGAQSAIGIDGSLAQLGSAVERGEGAHYLQGLATQLPVATASVDAAVSVLVLEHVADLDAALDEVARILVPGGRFLVFINHPLLQTPGSGWIDDQMLDPPEKYWRVGPYLPEQVTVEQVDAHVRLPFFHRPLSRYLNALAERGLVLEHMEEPPPPVGVVGLGPSWSGIEHIPRMMMLRLTRR